MGNVSLLFGGVALFLNSLSLFGKVDLKSAGLFSVLTGLLQTFIATWLVIGAAGDPALTFGYASIYLFAFTYLYVGITFLFGLDGSGVGWFSLFVAIAALFYAGVSFGTGDWIGGATWIFWFVLWGLFFLGMGLNLSVDPLRPLTGCVEVGGRKCPAGQLHDRTSVAAWIVAVVLGGDAALVAPYLFARGRDVNRQTGRLWIRQRAGGQGSDGIRGKRHDSTSSRGPQIWTQNRTQNPAGTQLGHRNRDTMRVPNWPTMALFVLPLSTKFGRNLSVLACGR